MTTSPCGCKPCDGGCAPETPLNGIHYCAQHDCDTHAKGKRRYLGNFSAHDYYGVSLSCHHCNVSWTGCEAAADCLECGAPKDYRGDGACLCEECRAIDFAAFWQEVANGYVWAVNRALKNLGCEAK